VENVRFPALDVPTSLWAVWANTLTAASVLGKLLTCCNCLHWNVQAPPWRQNVKTMRLPCGKTLWCAHCAKWNLSEPLHVISWLVLPRSFRHGSFFFLVFTTISDCTFRHMSVQITVLRNSSIAFWPPMICSRRRAVRRGGTIHRSSTLVTVLPEPKYFLSFSLACYSSIVTDVLTIPRSNNYDVRTVLLLIVTGQFVRTTPWSRICATNKIDWRLLLCASKLVQTLFSYCLISYESNGMV